MSESSEFQKYSISWMFQAPCLCLCICLCLCRWICICVCHWGENHLNMLPGLLFLFVFVFVFIYFYISICLCICCCICICICHWGENHLNMLPGLAKGTLNSSIQSRRVTSSALFNFEPWFWSRVKTMLFELRVEVFWNTLRLTSVRSFTESSCFKTKPRIAVMSAWYSWGWTWVW